MRGGEVTDRDQKWVERLASVIGEYLVMVRDPDADVARILPPDQLRERLDFSLSEKGCGTDDLFRTVRQYLEHSVKTAHRQFFNQLWSGFSMPGFIGDVIASLANTSMYTYEAAPVATLMEKELIRKMGGLAGFENPEGLFVTGGSNGNLLALLLARDRILPNVKQAGFPQAVRLTAFVSDQAHYSFEKAANLLGFGETGILKVPANVKGSLSPGDLERAVSASLRRGETPFFVAATAGTTVKGGFDLCRPIADIARRHRLWFHVDGSFGGSVLLSPRHRRLLDGLERADSFIWNPHKLMGLPLICSVFLARRPGLLRRAIATGGTQYIFHEGGYEDFDLGPFSLQCGRRVDALKLWLSWKYYGDRGYSDRIDRFFELAAYAEGIVRDHPGLELMAPRTSLCICFRCTPPGGRDVNAFNLKVRESLIRSGRTMVNYSFLEKNMALRLVIANHEMTREDIDRFFEFVLEEASSG